MTAAGYALSRSGPAAGGVSLHLAGPRADERRSPQTLRSLRMSDRAYVMESGSVVLSGPGTELAEDDRVRAAYLGL